MATYCDSIELTKGWCSRLLVWHLLPVVSHSRSGSGGCLTTVGVDCRAKRGAGRLQLARGVDVHQRVAAGENNHGLHGWPSLTLGKLEKRQALAQPIRVIRGSERYNHGLHGCASLTFGKPEERRTLVKPIRVIRGSYPFGLCDNAIPGQPLAMKVDNIADRKSRGLEVVHQLCLVFGKDLLHGFQFQDNPVAADEVCDVLLRKGLITKEDGQLLFTLKGNLVLPEGDCESFLVDGLEESGAEFVEDRKASTDDLGGKFFKDQHGGVLSVGVDDNHGLRGYGSLTLPNMLWRRTLVKPIRVIRGSEKIGMRASAGQFEDENVIFDLVDEKPIRGDVTFAMVCPVAGERMVSVGGGQRFAVGELCDDGLQLRNRKMSLESLFVVPGVCSCGANAVLHFSRSFQRSSRLSYVGQLGSLTMRSPSSIAAMVSALGTCGASMMKGIRRSRTTVLMYTVMTDDAESPTSSQKSVNCFLVGASSENVMLAIVISPNYYSNVRELYTNLTPLVKWIGWVDNHGLHGCASLTFGKPKERQALAQPIRVIRGSKNTLVPVGVGARYEHPRMADGEDVHLVADDFVHDAIGFDDQLVKPLGIRRYGVETLKRNIGAREGEMLKLRNVADDFVVPANGIFVRKLLLDRKKNVLKERLRVWGELRCHWAALDTACLRRVARTLRDTVSSGMPLPSANSRREISTSRESSMLSISASKSVASTRYDVARPFCVMRIGRCVSRGRLMYDEKFWRHSEKGTTSSDGRQRLMGRSRSVGMVLSPLMDGIVQNLAPRVKVAA